MTSAWEIKRTNEFGKLDRDIETEVAIVGGGLAGLWCAYLLSREGKKVVLLDCDKLGRAATLYTTGFITEVIDTDFGDLVRIYGEEKARLSWRAGEEAIELIETTVKEEGIDCEFMRLPFYSYAKDDKELEKLRGETKALNEAGLKAHMIGTLPRFLNAGAMEIPDQAKYHPMKFFDALVGTSLENGVEFYEETEVAEVAGSNKPHVLTKDGIIITAEAVVVATYSPLNNPKPTHWKKGMYTSYVYELEVPKGTFPDGMYEDQMNPYHYFRFDDLEDRGRVIVGGEDHRAELGFEESKSFRALKEFIDETFPELDYKVRNRWSGGILEPSDGLPLIGEYAPKLFLASAFSGNGMTYSAISGKILRDLVLGRRSKFEALYDPKRTMRPKALMQKFLDYGGEFLGGAVKNLFK